MREFRCSISEGETQGRVVPESFTHGTSEQRAEWLRQGLTSGRIEECDTFRSNTR